MTATYQSRRVIKDTGTNGWLEGVELLSPRTHLPIAHYFGGVRYAQAPIGELRFRKTRQLPTDFNYGSEQNPADCSKSCNVCPQPDWTGVLEPSDRQKWNEDCVQANIWIPVAEEPPASGWPVLFHIHGGFLQFGEPNKSMDVIARLYDETKFRAIVVMPAYRVNMFGFLAGKELEAEARADDEHAGNMGFWDQRTALEWTARIIRAFNGDVSNITVSGYSAGAHSVFHQLSHDLYRPQSESLIARAIMWSNGSGVQPKTFTRQQPCFDGLIHGLSIDPNLSATEKLQTLRKIPAHVLIDCIDSLPYSQFRATSDDAFVRMRLFENIVSGEYASRMRERGVQLMIGDCRDEHNLYRAWRPPRQLTYEALRHRLSEDYPMSFVDQVLHLYAPNQQLVKDLYKDWVDLFGYIYADLQVHCLERGFLQSLAQGTSDCEPFILRYCVERRMRCADAFLPKEWQVTHATDDALWWWGNGWSVPSRLPAEGSDVSISQRDVQVGLEVEEKRMCKPLFEAFANFVRGGIPQVEAESQLLGKETRQVQEPQLQIRNVLRLRSDGTTDVHLEENDLWEKALMVWDVASASRDTDRGRHDG